MRRDPIKLVSSLAATMAMFVSLAGCTGPDLTSDGIGDGAYVPVETDTRVLDSRAYFFEMCKRAGRCPDGVNSRVAPQVWSHIVFASLNDIDERCSAYLSSLDSARRDKIFWNKAWTDLSTPAKAILAQTNPGVEAIGVVAAIFDFGRSSINDYYSAIILTEEPSIIERIVRKLQTQYRTILDAKLRNSSISLSGAHYAVRGYLRLCLPTSIESELQAVKTNVDYAANGDRTTLTREAALLKVLDAIPIAWQQSPGDGNNGNNGNGNNNGTNSDTGNSVPTPEEIAKLRDALCLTPVPGQMSIQGDLKTSVEQFKIGFRNSQLKNPPDEPRKQWKLIIDKGTCEGTQFESAWERWTFMNKSPPIEPDPVPKAIQNVHAQLKNALRCLSPETVLPSGFESFTSFGPESRKAIVTFRDKVDSLPSANFLDAITKKELDARSHCP